MSLAIRLLFTVGLVSALPFSQRGAEDYSEVASRDGQRLGELGQLGYERLQRGEEGSYRNFKDAKNILQVLEALGGKIKPRKITNDKVNESGLLQLTEEELDEADRIVKRIETNFLQQILMLTSVGFQRYKAGEPANWENYKEAEETLNLFYLYFGGQAGGEITVLNAGLLHLTKVELMTLRFMLGKLIATKVEN